MGNGYRCKRQRSGRRTGTFSACNTVRDIERSDKTVQLRQRIFHRRYYQCLWMQWVPVRKDGLIVVLSHVKQISWSGLQMRHLPFISHRLGFRVLSRLQLLVYDPDGRCWSLFLCRRQAGRRLLKRPDWSRKLKKKSTREILRRWVTRHPNETNRRYRMTVIAITSPLTYLHCPHLVHYQAGE